MPEFAALTPEALADRIADRAFALPAPAVVAVDGADAADPVRFARTVADRAVGHGRAAAVIALHDFVRPASLRYEFGRTDELSYRTAWFDYAALNREVLQPLRDHHRYLPALWNERTDRAARAATRATPPNTVLFVAGPMLLGRDLPFDLTVSLRMSDAALRRTTPEADHFTIAALRAHEREHPDEPDITVAWDHPGRPALRLR
ncbi:hypothetical protein [Nocardia sp. CC227C]|uniref:hypothetical protein n=1 Tax=Nocardia sp. CC227C TaxID=3044562 RepID=UPI00278C2043|nr:hypothetical protein [Nocardia sp. CC227C]